MESDDHKKKKQLIDSKNKQITQKRQAELLWVSYSSIFYVPRENPENEKLMNFIDETYTKYPFFWSRRLKEILKQEWYHIGRYKVHTLMQKMWIQAIYPKPKTSIPNKQHKKYPYLLKLVEINKVNQVWWIDITYIRMNHGWVYLIAIIDWYSRKVVSWKVSNSMDLSFCKEVLLEALETGIPQIFNSDQWSQFTSKEFTKILEERNIQISMDGRGRYLDNIFTERLWRTVKQEEVYLKSYETPLDAYQNLKQYFEFYNKKRPHQYLNYRTPDEVYYGKN